MNLKDLSKKQLIDLVQGTERKFAESNAHAAELIIELEATHQKLQSTFEELLQASKMTTMGKIISDVCHDLANPLAIVIGYLDILLASKNIPSQELSIINKAVQGCKRAQKILNHLRHYIRKSPENMTKYCDLKVICEQSVDFFKNQLTNHQIHVEYLCHESIFTEIDDTHLESILQNLIVNSRDAFMEGHGAEEQRIKITLSKEDQQSALIAFEDNAGGIPKKYHDKIFKDFFTTKAPDKGTGLGLSLVKRLVDSFGGSIQMESKEGVGTTFFIRIPIKEGRGLAPQEEQGADRLNVLPLQKEKLLLVDDEPDILNILTHYLAKYFFIDSFSDPSKALESIRSQRYDIIITDMAMPHGSGLDILNASLLVNPHAFKVVISGHVATLNQDLKDIAQKSDMIFYKPLPSMEIFLEKILQGMLKKSKGQEKNSA